MRKIETKLITVFLDYYICLVGGLEHFLFSHILGIIIPIDFHIFQRGGPTTNQMRMHWRAVDVCRSSQLVQLVPLVD